MFLEISFILLLCLKVITILYKNEFKVDMSLLTQKIKYEKAEFTAIRKYLSIYLSIKNNERTNKKLQMLDASLMNYLVLNCFVKET